MNRKIILKDLIFFLSILILLPGCFGGSKVQRTETIPPTFAPTQKRTPTLTPTNVPTISIVPTQQSEVPIATSLTPEKKELAAGIYPVIWQEDRIKVWMGLDEASSLDLEINTPMAFPSPDGKFIAYINGHNIFTQNINMSESNEIPHMAGSLDGIWAGSWSPDARYLVYSISPVFVEGNKVKIDEKPTIFLSDLVRHTVAQITTGDLSQSGPKWSPDNKWIAFTSNRINPNNHSHGDIFIISTNCVSDVQSCKDSFARQLTHVGLITDYATGPSWSPDGTHLAYIYVNGRTGSGDIYLVDSTWNSRNVTNTPDQDENVFSWSPDGKHLVFRRDNPLEGTDLLILDLQSSKVTNITNSPNIEEGTPYWSPDGQSITYGTDNNKSESDISIYSLKDNITKTLANSSGGNFLFWMSVFPEISNGVKLMVSPAGHDLNLRDNPSINSNVIGKIHSGETITILAEPVSDEKNNWWKIKSDKGEGWVVGNYNWYLPVFP